ncbi:PD-(D/E)XK nuclease family protein [Chloroflexota bacterium]
MDNSNDFEDFSKLLESLVVNNPELERLEALLEQFNIFEAIGAVRQELRHSDFLAFLLNPNQNHSLSDTFVKGLLQKALISAAVESLPVTPIDLDIWNLNDLIVLREWQNIDILLVDEQREFVVVIENKVISGEHSDQLTRYYKIVNDHYPGWRILFIYLTPEGLEPTDLNYIQLDYITVAELVEYITESRESTLGPDVRTLMTHYSQMLRRYIVSESEIADLCQKIYRKHKRALDMIYEYRPDRQEEIRELLVNLIQEDSDLELDHSTKTYIRFAVLDWDKPVLLQGQGWTDSNRILLFEFGNQSNRLNLNLIIGPGPDEARQRLLDIAHEQSPPFKPAFKALGKKFNTIFQRKILTAKSLENSNIEEIEDEIRKKFNQFMKNDLPKITNVLKRQAWI